MCKLPSSLQFHAGHRVPVETEGCKQPFQHPTSRQSEALMAHPHTPTSSARMAARTVCSRVSTGRKSFISPFVENKQQKARANPQKQTEFHPRGRAHSKPTWDEDTAWVLHGEPTAGCWCLQTELTSAPRVSLITANLPHMRSDECLHNKVCIFTWLHFH